MIEKFKKNHLVFACFCFLLGASTAILPWYLCAVLGVFMGVWAADLDIKFRKLEM